MTNETRRDPLVVGLLAAIAVLLAIQLATQAYVLARVQREADALRPSMDRALAQLEVLERRLQSDGPRQIAVGADEIARQTLGKVKEFNARRAALDGTRRGPLDKVDQVIALNQLLADELAAMLYHFAMTQGVLARPGLGGGDGEQDEGAKEKGR